jgi:predicted ATP-binding protein involved in virulence
MDKVDIRLDKLVLRNYKGFYTGDDENGVEITFDKKLTVFIGDNGSGKSAVLDAVALFLGKLREEITSVGEVSSIYPFPPHSEEKKNRSVNNNSDIERAELDAFFKLSPTPIWENENDNIEREPNIGLSIEMLKIKSPNEIQVSKWFDHSKLGYEEFDTTTNDKKTLEYFLSDNIYDPFSKGEFNDKEIDRGIPVLIYYGANTINTTIQGKLEDIDISVFDAYRDALDANKFSFKQFFVWFDAEKKKLTQKIINGEAERDEEPNKHLSNAIKQILIDDNENYYSKLDIDWSEHPHDMTLFKRIGTKGNSKLSFDQLSSGERTLIALVADLTRRLCLANPNAENPLHGNGIVLIDEIDVHLHPKWQQKVVTKLREVFPNVQFVVTTHSPLVLTNLPDEQFKVYRLRNGGVENFDKVRGMRLIEIFYNLYDTPARPQKVQKDIDELFDAIDDEDVETAQKLFDNLKKILSENDPAMIEAKTFLKYMPV